MSVSSAANVLWLPLGELLVERGLLSKVQLNIALAQQKQSGRRLGEVLVELGYVSEPALARTLLEQVGLTESQPETVAEPQPVEPVRTLPAPPPLLRAPTPPVVEPVADAPQPAAPAPSPAPVHYVAPVQPVAAPPAPAPAPAPQPEPRIVRLDADADERDRWWMRSRHDARIAELERVLLEFEQRSKEIENDITRVRGVIAELRQTRI